MRAHRWVNWGAGGRRSTVDVHRPLCVHCGRLWLRNDASDRWCREECPGKEDDR